MDRFSKHHPTVLLLYYLAVFITVLTVNNPVFSLSSLLGAVLYCFRIMGKKLFSSLKFLVPLLVLVSVFNMLFAHYGEDILFSLGDTEFTLEALFYGFNQGVVLVAVILWFNAFSYSFDSDKISSAFRFTPKLALIFSMVIGFIPRFNRKLESIRDAQLGLNGGNAPQGLSGKFRQGLDNLSALVTYSLESSIITADSMEARGYNQRAVRKSAFKLRAADFIMLFITLCLSICVMVIKAIGSIEFVFEPVIYYESFSITATICFMILQLLPIIVDLWEDIRWKLSSSRA